MHQYIKKWLSIPSKEVVVVEACELYEVRWTSRSDVYSHSIKPEVEVFPSKQEAELFYEAITNAFKLIRHTGLGTAVTINKRD